jgi:hypothetical protein
MGTNISGVVEALCWADADLWLPIVDAGFILRRDYDAFARLFGVRNSQGFAPVAAGRGFPNGFTKAEIWTLYKCPNDPHLDGDINCYAPTWMTWPEMQSIDWSKYDIDWRLLFQLMQALASFPDFSDLRLVVWFDN